MERRPQDIVVEYFVTHPTATNIEISENTGISKSSVQRYLANPDIGNIEIPSTGRIIAEQIKLNTVKGRQKGGRNTFQTHTPIRNEIGQIVGTQKDSQPIDKEELKKQDIMVILNCFSHHPTYTMDQLAAELSGVKIHSTGRTYTADYVYRCLNDSRIEELIGPLLASAISARLDANRYGILRKLDGLWGAEFFEQAGLTDQEIAVLDYRFTPDGIHSSEAAAHHFGVSKTTINNIENKAVEKLKAYQERMKEM